MISPEAMLLIFSALALGAALLTAVYLEWLHRNDRHAEITRLRDEYAELTRRRAPREHVRRQLVELQCEELKACQ